MVSPWHCNDSHDEALCTEKEQATTGFNPRPQHGGSTKSRRLNAFRLRPQHGGSAKSQKLRALSLQLQHGGSAKSWRLEAFSLRPQRGGSTKSQRLRAFKSTAPARRIRNEMTSTTHHQELSLPRLRIPAIEAQLDSPAGTPQLRSTPWPGPPASARLATPGRKEGDCSRSIGVWNIACSDLGHRDHT